MNTEPSAGPEASGNRVPDGVEALKLEYEYVRNETIRLRDGRASLTRQLGPLPISAAIVAGLVTGFTSTVHRNAYLWSALILFGLLVVISILYSSMKPYRVLRREIEADFRRSTQSPAGGTRTRSRWRRRRPASRACKTAIGASGADCSSFRDSLRW